MADPQDDDARVRELVTGFALGDLADDELRELHDRLRAPGDAGARAARAAWETLGTVVDLRAELGAAFQDAVRLRIMDGGEGGEDFQRRLRERLRASRPKLQPVPPATPSVRRHPMLWLVLGSVPLAFALAVVWVSWPSSGDQPVAEVHAVEGAVTVEGRAVVAGTRIDRRPLLIPAGARIELAWPTAHATLLGPANAVAGSNGLTLTHGSARIRATGSFAIGLPDRAEPASLAAGSELAVEVRDGVSLLGCASGAADVGSLRLGAGQALAGAGAPFAWNDAHRVDCAQDGCVLQAPLDGASWTLEGRLQLSAPDAAWVMTLAGPATVTLGIAAGTATVAVDGQERTRLALSGPPLATRRILVACIAGTLRGTVDDREWSAPLGAGVTSVRWSGPGDLQVTGFRTGPTR